MTIAPLSALRDKPESSGFAGAPSGDPEPSVGGDDTRLVCRKCRTKITDSSKIFAPGGGAAARIFTNPGGVVCQVLTVTAAQSLALIGPRTDEYTWFAGYAWRIALCASCLTHLGWHYQALQVGTTPADFFGLLVTELAEEKD